VQLGAADPDRGHADEHVGRAGFLQVDLSDLERTAVTVENGGARLHGDSLSRQP
jgi:hypothetical protein